MAPNPTITSVTWPGSPKEEGQRLRTDISYRNDGTDGELFSRVVDDRGVVLDSFVSSVAAGEICTDSVRFYMPAHDVTIYAQVGVGSTVTSEKGPKTIYLSEPTPTPHIDSVTIKAPSSAEKNVSFTLSGTVKDQYGSGMRNVSVKLYDNGSYFGTETTNSVGAYSKTRSIGIVGIHELA
ncbi:unnamed protein product, partial [marine sediment metagenome]